jgi:hypothetical protein
MELRKDRRNNNEVREWNIHESLFTAADSLHYSLRFRKRCWHEPNGINPVILYIGTAHYLSSHQRATAWPRYIQQSATPGQVKPTNLRTKITLHASYTYKLRGFLEFEARRFREKVVRSSALCTGRLYPKEIYMPLTSSEVSRSLGLPDSEARW